MALNAATGFPLNPVEVALILFAGDSDGQDPASPWRSLRDRLLDLVRRRPGVRLSTLWRSLQADRGTAKYHLLFLERAHIIEAVRTKGLTRFFPADMGLPDRTRISLLRRGRILEVARVVTEQPGVAQRGITASLPISRKVFRRYADLLVACNLLTEIREGKERHYFATPELQELLIALESEEPFPKANDSRTPDGPA